MNSGTLAGVCGSAVEATDGSSCSRLTSRRSPVRAGHRPPSRAERLKFLEAPVCESAGDVEAGVLSGGVVAGHVAEEHVRPWRKLQRHPAALAGLHVLDH